jgi:hypothetical protein
MADLLHPEQHRKGGSIGGALKGASIVVLRCSRFGTSQVTATVSGAGVCRYGAAVSTVFKGR